MATITDYFEQAQLSMAAYALNLAPGEPDMEKLTDAGMSATQAAAFANAYSVVDQYTDAVLSSLFGQFDPSEVAGELDGGVAADRLYGMGGDVIEGGADHDTVFGSFGDDSIGGGVGNDWLDGHGSATCCWGAVAMTGCWRVRAPTPREAWTAEAYFVPV